MVRSRVTRGVAAGSNDAIEGAAAAPGSTDSIVRHRLAAEIHDSALQSMLAASQDLEAAAAGDARAQDYARAALRHAISELRHVLGGSSVAGSLTHEGLEKSLLKFVADAARRGGFTAALQIDPAAELKHPALLIQLVREFVGNAARHARARNVIVALTTDELHMRLVVRDDGVGLPEQPADPPTGHLGLALSGERVREVGGTVHVDSAPGRGTTITVTLPRDARSAHDYGPGGPPPEREPVRADADVDAESGRPQPPLHLFPIADRRDADALARDLAAAARELAAAVRDRDAERHRDEPVADARKRADENRLLAADDRRHTVADHHSNAAARADGQHDRVAVQDAFHEAHVDDLTGSHQRAIGMLALQAEIERARRSDGRLALAFIDVDDLKGANDRHGHAAGDQLLKDVVASLRAELRSYDPIVRAGGDEFICAMIGIDLLEARGRFASIHAALDRVHPGASISVGLAELRAEENLDALIARGDAALYRSRRR